MAFHVFAIVLIAAFLHAAWNLLVKINLDRFLAIFLIHVLMGATGLGLLAWSGLPAPAAWPFALGSAALHMAYNVLLARSYSAGDMSIVYPVARGASPGISLVLSIFLAGDVIDGRELAGLGILIAGLWLVALSCGTRLTGDNRAMGFALATAVFIGLYTVTDGLGARAAHDAAAYCGLIFFLDGLYMLVLGVSLRGPAIIGQVAPFFWRGLLGSVLSALAYGLVIWAMTVEKIGPVAALRETSIFFVLIMSRVILKEQLTPLRIAGGCMIVAGAAVLRFA